MTSTLCFGGSFNPIHNGHLTCARTVAEKSGFKQVLLIPSGTPPHKQAAVDLAEANDRLAMCHIVAAADPLFHETDIEMRRSGPSYTIDTVRELRGDVSEKVNWLIGADMLNFLPNWREARRLLDEVNFIVIARPGFVFEWEKLPAEFQVLKTHVLEAPLVDVSATEIRQRVRAGQPIDSMVPPAVARYIETHRLYK